MYDKITSRAEVTVSSSKTTKILYKRSSTVARQMNHVLNQFLNEDFQIELEEVPNKWVNLQSKLLRTQVFFTS